MNGDVDAVREGGLSFRRLALQRLPDLLPLRGGAVSLARRFNALSLPKLLHEMDVPIFSLRSRRQNRAWGGAQRNLRYDQDLSRKPADAGDSHWLNDYEMANYKKLPPASRARCAITQYSWGSAFGYTPGYILSPASAG